MIVTCVYVHVKPEAADRFIDATSVNCRESIKEPGNLRFDLIRETADPNRFMLYEAYESEEAVVEHKNTSHYLKWRDTVQDFMAEPRKWIRYSIVEPKDRSQW